MIIVNLNIRGLGGGTKARYLRHIIGSEGAEFVCVQETKLKEISDGRCFSLWGDNNIGWLHNKGDDGNGSLLSLWHKEAFKISLARQRFYCSVLLNPPIGVWWLMCTLLVH